MKRILSLVTLLTVLVALLGLPPVTVVRAAETKENSQSYTYPVLPDEENPLVAGSQKGDYLGANDIFRLYSTGVATPTGVWGSGTADYLRLMNSVPISGVSKGDITTALVYTTYLAIEESTAYINLKLGLFSGGSAVGTHATLAPGTLLAGKSVFSDRLTKVDLVMTVNPAGNYAYKLYYNNILGSSGTFTDNKSGAFTKAALYFDLKGALSAPPATNVYIGGSTLTLNMPFNDEGETEYIPNNGTGAFSGSGALAKYVAMFAPGYNLSVPAGTTVADIYAMNSTYYKLDVRGADGAVLETTDASSAIGKIIYIDGTDNGRDDGLYSKIAQIPQNPAPALMKSENFSALDFGSRPADGTATSAGPSGTNNLGITTGSMRARVWPVVEANSLGGKAPGDKYLCIRRNSTADNSSGYYYGPNFDANASANNVYVDEPFTVGFSVYAPDTDGAPFYWQMGLIEPGAAAALGVRLGFVTDQSVADTNQIYLDDAKFPLNADEWNRVSVTMYPNSTYTEVAVNGVVHEFSRLKNDANGDPIYYGVRMQRWRLFLPAREGVTDEFLALDDVFMYRGFGHESYLQPSGGLTRKPGADALVKGGAVYLTADADAAAFGNLLDLSGGNLTFVTDASANVTQAVIWDRTGENGNPVAKYYSVKALKPGELELESVTPGADGKSFDLKYLVNGSGGVLITAAYSAAAAAELVNADTTPLSGLGYVSKNYPINGYSASHVYRAFLWNSFQTLTPAAEPCDLD